MAMHKAAMRLDEQKNQIVSETGKAEGFIFSVQGGEKKVKNWEKKVKLVRWDPDKIALQDLFCAGYMLCEMVVREEETQV